MAQKVANQPFDSADLQELMVNTAGWAQKWDDVLWYLKVVGEHDKELSMLDVPAMMEAVKDLNRRKARFTTDHRELYKELSGQDCHDATTPAPVKNLPLRMIAEKWLGGLLFPASREDAVARAKANHAPAHILEALKALDKPIFHDVGALLQRLVDLARHRG